MRRRMGRPGLIGTAARTAVIAGTATATMNAMAPRPQHPAQPPVPPMQQPQSTPPPPAAGGLNTESIAKLKQLGELRDSGVLSEAEFSAAKAKLLG